MICYINQLTLFCGTLVLHSNRIKANRNSILWCIKHNRKSKDLEKDLDSNHQLKSRKSVLKSIKNSNILKKLNEIYKSLKNFYKFLITNKYGKCIVAILFVIYISFSTYNVSKIKEGLEIKDLVAHDSYFADFSKQNFGEFDLELPVMLIIDQPFDYTNKSVRNQVMKFLNDVREIEGINKEFLINWMSVYTDELKEMRKTKNSELILKKIFDTSSPFINDLVLGFNKLKNKTEIIASRFYIKYQKTYLSSKDAKVMNNIKELAKNSEFSFKAYAGKK